MEEYNLTFLEAVEALNEEKAEKIETESGCQYEIKGCIVNYTGNADTKITGVTLTARSFLGKWRLVDPKPVKRKEIIEGIIWHGGNGKAIYPTAYPGEAWSKFIGKSPMKMTLEWEE